MSETQFPSPHPPGAALSTGTAATDRPVIRDAPVVQAPPSLAQPEKTLLLDGKVVSSDPKSGEIRIATGKGEIVVQSQTPLPPHTEVAVELRMQHLSLRAQITVLRQKSAEAQAAQNIAPPPGTSPAAEPVRLAPGMTLQALRLPPEAPPPATGVQTTQTPPPASPAAMPPSSAPETPAPLTLEQAAHIIDAARRVGIARLPALLPALPPIPMPVLWQVLNTKDVLSALQKLPPHMQQQVTAFLQQPDVMAALQKIVPPGELAAIYPAAPLPPTPATAASPAPPLAADTMTDMVAAQIAAQNAGAKTAASGPPAPPPALPPAQAPVQALRGLLPLLEAMLPGVAQALPGLPGPFAAPAVPFIPKGVPPAPLPQNMVKVTILSVLPPAPPPTNAATAASPESEYPAPAAPLPPDAMEAEVESLTPGGFPILRLQDGQHIVLQQPVETAPGARLALLVQPMPAADILAAAAPIFPAAAAAPGMAFDPLATRGWPALQEALQVLADPAAAATQLLRNTVPAPVAARMTPAALFFLAALRIGSVESWLGENILQALRQSGRKDIAERLGMDFQRLSAQSKTPLAGDWRVISLPLLQDEHLSQIQFYVRQQQERDAQGEEGDGKPRQMTRFILNLSLSRMGDMQLDGLMHKKRLDLILRSEEKLPFDIRQQIMQRFASGIEQANMQGGISFQTRREGWTIIETQPPGVRDV